MTFLEELLKANKQNEDKPFFLEIYAIPSKEGGGFHICIPPLGRYFACADGKSMVEATDRLDTFLAEVLTDDEHRQMSAEAGITIPDWEENE